MNQWELIRLRCLRDQESVAQVARDTGISENTIRKYLRNDQPPKKIVLQRPSVLDPFLPFIDDYLKETPKITSRRIGKLLRQRHKFTATISDSMMRRYIARRRENIVPREVFIRADYQPGDQAQFDFSPMKVCLAGVETKVQLFVMRLSYSGYFFARVSLHEDHPALFRGLNEALTFFGGVPRVAIFDNAKTAVKKVYSGRKRLENEAFQAFRGALTLEVVYAAPAKGNEKGGVEGTHGYIEDNFFRPMPHYPCITSLNDALEKFCLEEINRIHSVHRESVRERFTREVSHLRPLPLHMPKPSVTELARVNKFSEITIDTSRYSVPTQYAFRHVTVEKEDETISILLEGVVIAQHPRASRPRSSVIDPLHYVEILQRKHRAAPRALALAKGRVPDALKRLYAQLSWIDEETATKKWTRVLALATRYSFESLAQAVEVAMTRGCYDADTIELILRQKQDPLQPLELFEGLPKYSGSTTDLTDYTLSSMIEVAS